MTFKLRDYQQQASDKAVVFFQSKTAKNAIEVLPTGSGKMKKKADLKACNYIFYVFWIGGVVKRSLSFIL